MKKARIDPVMFLQQFNCGGFVFKIISVALGCLVLILFGINCSKSVNNMSGASQATLMKNGGTDESGNGQPYGGKILPGVYVRQLTEKICGSHIKNLGEITVTDNNASGKLVDVSTCSLVDVNLNLKEIEYAEYKQGRIGYFEGIYMQVKSDSSINIDVAGIDEIWCRKEGSSSTIGFDVVIKADYSKKIFTAVTASAIADSNGLIVNKLYKPQAVERRFEDLERVRYRADGFDLEIRRRDYNSLTGMMQGELVYELNGLNSTLKLNCRLGGELDVMIPKP